MNEPVKPPVCLDYPEFDRLNYHYGQMLGARDFTTEQDFFRNKMKMLNRCLHGYGVVCGLEVKPSERAASKVEDGGQKGKKEEKHTLVDIDCGLALDQEGNELAVRTPLLCVDLWAAVKQHASEKELAGIGDATSVWVSLCYLQKRIERTKATHDDCSNYCTYAKIRDAVCVQVTPKPPAEDKRCEPCCESPDECCVLLARIDNFVPGEPVEPDDIHNEVRRPLGSYVPTTITGINWEHGAWYSQDKAEELLPEYPNGDPGGGLTIHFSRQVRTETIRPGVVDVWKTDDWSGPSTGEFSSLSTKLELPKSDWTDEFTIKVFHNGFRNDERILIIVRTDFILDHCCRPVDGNHVGGNVPRIGGDCETEIPCADVRKKRGLYGPWQSGNGVPGGTFESWFFVGNKPSDNQK